MDKGWALPAPLRLLIVQIAHLADIEEVEYCLMRTIRGRLVFGEAVLAWNRFDGNVIDELAMLSTSPWYEDYVRVAKWLPRC